MGDIVLIGSLHRNIAYTQSYHWQLPGIQGIAQISLASVNIGPVSRDGAPQFHDFCAAYITGYEFGPSNNRQFRDFRERETSSIGDRDLRGVGFEMSGTSPSIATVTVTLFFDGTIHRHPP